METVTGRLAAFATGLRYDALPEDVVAKAKTCLLHSIGAAIPSYNDPLIRALRDLASADAPARRDGARIYVYGDLVSPLEAAFVNAAMSHRRTQEDTYATYLHMGVVVVPTVLAVGERLGRPGKDLLAAIVAGYEVTAAIGKDLVAYTTPKGLRPTSLYAVFGAAAAAGRLLGLAEAQAQHALGHAANFGMGLTECLRAGSLEWCVEVGMAARNGVLAAMLAQKGVAAAGTAIEGDSGFLKAFVGTTEPACAIGRDLGRTYEILKTTLKPFPSGMGTQSPITAMLNLLRRHPVAAQDIEEIELRMNPHEARYPSQGWGPFATADATVGNNPYHLAVACVEGKVTRQGLQRYYDDPLVLRVTRKVRVVADDRLAPLCCRVAIRTRDGARHEEGMDVTPTYFSFDFDRDLGVVREMVAESDFPLERVEQMAEVIRHIERLPNAKRLVSLIVRRQSRRGPRATTP
ncbi:MAG: MmgE/PrpD family protein [Chloroflexi bacterium]|nr:MmgE/PrpD family protein [Chloroflexota bacterium]